MTTSSNKLPLFWQPQAGTSRICRFVLQTRAKQSLDNALQLVVCPHNPAQDPFWLISGQTRAVLSDQQQSNTPSWRLGCLVCWLNPFLRQHSEVFDLLQAVDDPIVTFSRLFIRDMTSFRCAGLARRDQIWRVSCLITDKICHRISVRKIQVVRPA